MIKNHRQSIEAPFIFPQYQNGPYNSSHLSSLSNNFFTLSVNSQKLTQIFEGLQKTIKFQGQKILKLDADFSRITHSLQIKFQQSEQKNLFQNCKYEKLQKRLNQNLQTYNVFAANFDKKMKYSELNVQKIEEDFQKLEKISYQNKKQLLMHLQKAIQDTKLDLIGSYGQGQQEFEKLQVEDKQRIQFKDLATMSQYFQDKMQLFKKDLEHKLKIQIQHNEEQLKKLKNQTKISLQAKNRMSLQSSFKNSSLIGNEYLNKIMRPRNSVIVNQVIQEDQSGQAQQKLALTAPNFQKFGSQLGRNQQNLVDINVLKNEFFGNNGYLAEIKNKMIILDEKADIISRKTDRSNRQINDIKRTLFRFQDEQASPMYTKHIQQLKIQIKYLRLTMDEQLSKKQSTESVQQLNKKLCQKISILHENMVDKAEKHEVQKAMVFLQAKIKQIILLIASKQNQQREGTLTKAAPKCLSCDKQVKQSKSVAGVQTENRLSAHKKYGKVGGYTNFTNHELLKNHYTRPLTTKLKKYREQTKNNKTVENEQIGCELQFY